ncbi:MAG: exonuclease SbcCD subunit D [Geminicoccaceae bacterium]
MSLRLLHTADWQLGKPFQNLPTEVAALVREARVATVRTIAALATRHEAAAVLVAGDIFDSNLVPERTIVQALAAMRGFAGPWVLLPGNHDARLAEGVWSRLERLGRPENVLLADSPSPIALADGRLVVLPAPLTERHATDDLTAWMDEATTSSGALRVGLAHGSIAGRLPEVADAPNPIDPERATLARLDYLALGDWHGTLEIAPRTWYAGTPEPDRFRTNDAGNVLLVELGEPGEAPPITRLATARHRWRQLELDLTGIADPKAALEPLFAELGGIEQALVQLTVTGMVDLAGRAALEAALERLAGEVCHLEVRDRLLAEPSERDLLALAGSPVVGGVARELAALAAEDPAQREVATLALRLLYLEHHRLGPAA